MFFFFLLCCHLPFHPLGATQLCVCCVHCAYCTHIHNFLLSSISNTCYDWFKWRTSARQMVGFLYFGTMLIVGMWLFFHSWSSSYSFSFQHSKCFVQVNFIKRSYEHAWTEINGFSFFLSSFEFFVFLHLNANETYIYCEVKKKKEATKPSPNGKKKRIHMSRICFEAKERPIIFISA